MQDFISMKFAVRNWLLRNGCVCPFAKVWELSWALRHFHGNYAIDWIREILLGATNEDIFIYLWKESEYGRCIKEVEHLHTHVVEMLALYTVDLLLSYWLNEDLYKKIWIKLDLDYEDFFNKVLLQKAIEKFYYEKNWTIDFGIEELDFFATYMGPIYKNYDYNNPLVQWELHWRCAPEHILVIIPMRNFGQFKLSTSTIITRVEEQHQLWNLAMYTWQLFIFPQQA